MLSITKAVFPVAGFGTRFLPATKAQPKEMLPLVDKPIIQYIVEEVVAAGIHEIIFITSQTKRAIEDHFDRNFELEYRLLQQKKISLLKEVTKIFKMAQFVYVRQPTPRGWGDAILQAEHLIGQQPFAVCFGDDVVDSRVPVIKQLMQAHQRYGGSILGAVNVARAQTDKYGIIDGVKLTKDTYRIKRIVEKPRPSRSPSTLAVIGRYILTPDIFPRLRRLKPTLGSEINPYQALQPAMDKGQVLAKVIEGERFDCGTKLDYLKATVHFALKHKSLRQPFKNYLRAQNF